MAEFLSQDEIDALLDISEQGEDVQELTAKYEIIKISEIINFSSDLIDNIQSEK